MKRALLLALWSFLACGEAPEPDRVPEAVPIERVVLVSLDTLRADHLGAYGYERPTSPNLDALAAEGVVFEDASSTSSWTLPAHASLLTGLEVARHRMRDERRSLTIRIWTLATILARRGWQTACVVNSFYLSERFGLSQGCEAQRYVQESASRVGPSTFVTDQAIRYAAEAATREAPFFLFVHYYDIHSDYAALPEHTRHFEEAYAGSLDGTTATLVHIESRGEPLSAEDGRHLRNLYDAGIRQTDAEIQRLIEGVDATTPHPERTLWIFTSDHGEEFGDHGGVLHGRTQFQEQLHVPLILRGPGIPAGHRVPEPVSIVDVAPTVLEMIGAEVPRGFSGVSLAAAARGGHAPAGRILASESRHGLDHPAESWAIRRGAWKLVRDRTGRDAAYELGRDPVELEPIAPESAPPELFERLRELAKPIDAPAPSGSGLSAAERDHLRALGYLVEPEAPDRGPAER